MRSILLQIQVGALLSGFQLTSGFETCSPLLVDPTDISLLQIARERGQIAKERGLNRQTVNYEPEKWNDVLPLRKSHNCYEYMLNDVDNHAVTRCSHLIEKHGKNSKTYKKCRRYFHIPGYHYHQQGLHRAARFNHSSVTCPNVLQRVALDGMGSLLWKGENGHPTKAVDNKGVKSWDHDDQCPTNYYMGSLVVKPHHRFHFYRRDRLCTDAGNKGKQCWSHKPGLLNATHLDASNKEIPNLHAADRSYGKHKAYNSVCGFFCVPSNAIESTHSDFFQGDRENAEWATV